MRVSKRIQFIFGLVLLMIIYLKWTSDALPTPILDNLPLLGDSNGIAVHSNINVQYGKNHFLCTQSGDLIPETKKCNCVPDCPNGEDEKDCGESRCPGHSGIIVNTTACVNDGKDCFQCYKSNQWISEKKKCDCKKNCPNGEDEENCVETRCPDNSGITANPNDCIKDGKHCFYCNNTGDWRPVSVKCNGKPDCPEEEDEDVKLCGYNLKDDLNSVVSDVMNIQVVVLISVCVLTFLVVISIYIYFAKKKYGAVETDDSCEDPSPEKISLKNCNNQNYK